MRTTTARRIASALIAISALWGAVDRVYRQHSHEYEREMERPVDDPADAGEKAEYTFARLRYRSIGRYRVRGGWDSWGTDANKSERQFIQGVRRLTRIHTRSVEHLDGSGNLPDDELETELDLPGGFRGCTDGAAGRNVDGRVWEAEVWSVGRVEEFGSEIEREPFVEPERARQHHIDVHQARTLQDICGGVAEGERRLHGEGLYVEPAVRAALAARQVPVVCQVSFCPSECLHCVEPLMNKGV
jgi:hypothetical protein